MSQAITDEKSGKLVTELHAYKIRRDLDSLKFLLDNELGRWFLMRLFDRCDLFASGFNSDASIMAFIQGKREIGLMYLGDIKTLGTSAVDKKLLAEKEYLDCQLNMLEHIRMLMDQNGDCE